MRQNTAPGCWATCNESSYTKNKYILYYYELHDKYFHIKHFFLEKTVFSEETAKNCSGGTFEHFLGNEGILRQKLM